LAEVVRTVWTDWYGTCIAVGFDDEAPAELFARRYAQMPTENPADVRAYAIREGGGVLFWIEGGRAFRWPQPISDPRGIEFLIDRVVRQAYFSALGPYLSFPAAAGAGPSGAFAIVAGASGGKTTTALACARRGVALYSEEHCVLDGANVLAFPRAVNVRAAEIESVLATGGDAPGGGLGARLGAHRGATWYCADFAELFGAARATAPQPLTHIFFLESQAPVPAIRALAEREALPLLLGAPLLSRERGFGRVAEATSILAQAAPYAVAPGSPDETARLLLDALGG
jgi:hypothetical protein